MASFNIAGAASPMLVVDHGAAYHVGSPIAAAAAAALPVATASHAPTGYMCKVTILCLEVHHGGYAADYVVTFSHAGQEATTPAKRCIAGQGAIWNESIEFPIMAGHDLSFVVEESGKPLAQTLGSASLAITTGTLDLPIMRNGDIRGLLKVTIGVAHPTAAPTAMTLAPPTHLSPLASQLRERAGAFDVGTVKIADRLAVGPMAVAPLMEHRREAVPVQVELVVERPRLEAIQAIPKVLNAAPAILSQAVLPVQTAQLVTTPVPMPLSAVPVAAPPAGEMCKVTVVSLESVGGVEQVTVKILYNGQEANTPARGVATAGGSTVACNDSIEFPVAGSQDLTFMVEDLGRREVLGAVATPVIPGLIELPVLDERRALRGKLKVAIWVYSGPPLGAALEKLPSTATLPAPPTQSWQSESFNYQTLPPTLASGIPPMSSMRTVAAHPTASMQAWLQRGGSASQLLQ